MNELLIRRDGESDLQYHRRLVYGKLVDKTLADVDYSELSEGIYGQKLASDECRKRMYGSKHTLDIVSRCSTPAVTTGDIDDKIMELKIERQKLFDQRAALNKSIREVARQQELSEIIERAVESGRLPELKIPEVQSDHTVEVRRSGRDLLVSLNDIHYGAVVNNAWRKYDSDVCKKMMYEYAERIGEIAMETGAEDCYIWNAGDTISGNIHRSIQVTNKENVIQQVCGVSELIATFVLYVSKFFNTTTYVSVAGNHSRIEANKKDSLVSERLDNLVGWYLDARLKNYCGEIVIANEATVDDTMFMLDIRGKRYVGVHGDFDASATSIQSLKTMCENIEMGTDIYAVLSGHLHHNKIDSVNGIKSIMAGSFLGTDDYCVQRRICGKPEQLVCVCDSSGVVCSYDIQFTE